MFLRSPCQVSSQGHPDPDPSHHPWAIGRLCPHMAPASRVIWLRQKPDVCVCVCS